jgi:hypothetical protein
MTEIKEDACNSLYQIYCKGIEPLIIENSDSAYIRDPIFDIKRNRVIAEVVKTIIRLKLKSEENIIQKFCNFLIKNQNADGSWNEIHPNYNQPSSLITSIIGEALLMNYIQSQNDDLKRSIQHACRFVLSQEKSPGFFIKSKVYIADHLNVDATCGAFLALYGENFSDDLCIKVAKQVARHIQDYQFLDGSYPYAINKGNYSYLLNVPCIHYQGVSLYYLSKIEEVIQEKWLEQNLLRGVEWLVSIQKQNGRFDWSKSGLMFAYYLTGAYAFAFSSFMYASRWDKKYLKHARLCLNILKRNIDTIFLRWEKDSWTTFPFSVPSTLQSAFIGNFPSKQKFFRFGYGIYRQMARRRFSKKPNENIFKNLTKILGIHSSTVEPFSNYTDLFMTSEILDCISYSLSFQKEGDYTLQ